MTWIRSGECPPERCRGRCCEHIGVWYDDTAEARLFMDVLRAKGVRVLPSAGKSLALIDYRCQHLTDDGRCGIYGQARRPQGCADWPQEPAQLIQTPDCGFEFTWSEPEYALPA